MEIAFGSGPFLCVPRNPLLLNRLRAEDLGRLRAQLASTVGLT